MVQQTIVAAELSTQHLWGCNAAQTLHSPRASRKPQHHQDPCPADTRFSIFSPTPHPSETSPCPTLKFYTGSLSWQTWNFPRALFQCAVLRVFKDSVSDKMRTQVPAWRVTAGGFTMKLSLSKVHICSVHFPGHAWIFAVLYVCWDLHKRNFCEQIQQNDLVAVRDVLSMDCISGHLLLTSLGTFTSLGSKEGLYMKCLLKKNECNSMIWPWNFSWKLPKHKKKTQTPKSPFWITLFFESPPAGSQLPPCSSSYSVVPALGHVLASQALEIPSSNPSWGSLTWQC